LVTLTERTFAHFVQTGRLGLQQIRRASCRCFGLPELIARAGERVFIVEGEKCACELATLGLLVTTSAHGAKSAHKTDWQPLAGREVVTLPDNDADGCAYAQTVAGILNQLSPSTAVRIVELPGLPSKGDCVDWLDARDAQTPEDIRAELLAFVKDAEVLRQRCVESLCARIGGCTLKRQDDYVEFL
jgi:DNA primase